MRLELLAALAVVLSACAGETGPAGPQGPPGKDGAPGKDSPVPPVAQVAYNSMPDTLPYAVSSHSFEGQGTSQFGEAVTLAPNTGRQLVRVTVLMSNYGETPAYAWPMTLNIYAPSDLTHPIAALTQVVNVPARPESNPGACNGNPQWLDPNGACHYSLAFPVVFDLSATLPDTLVYGIAYDTQSNGGPHQTGTSGDYNNLNVGYIAAAPSVGQRGDLYATITPSYDTGGGTYTTPTPGVYSVATPVNPADAPLRPVVKFEVMP